jgi:alpha-glucosidase/alpha-D-xyloside xylohydrolase
MWLHYPDDAVAIAHGDQYLWARDILAAPVVEKGASSRTLYLPKGDWYDFWTEEKQAGRREVRRDVDLATIPLYVRAGSIVPFGPVKQYTAEHSDEPVTFVIYPGADGAYTLYEDDGATFNYRRGEWIKTEVKWSDKAQRLSLKGLSGSKAPYKAHKLRIRIAGQQAVKTIEFSGRATEIQI